MKFQRHYSIVKGELNMAPLIDVIFQQLIYFMLTSSFIMQPGIKINLPQAVTSETVSEKEVIVSVSKEGIIFYGERPVTMEELEKLLQEETSVVNKNKVMVIKGDKKAEHGIVVGVMDIARRSGITKIVIGTTPEL
ncbi:MAG: biopolymer transporter ExbD [Candidatus Ratteibacteria bacterium]|nr:biopolymer transporter ExbD [Candidatus Ratteibacteria bacterium]